MLKLGIIVCAHGNGKAVSRLRAAYERENVDAIALCGDLGDDFKEISAVLKGVSAAKVPIIAFPGSHEPAADYYRALKKFKRIIDGTKTRRVTIKGIDIVTLPGSGVNVPHASFRIADLKLPMAYQKRYRLFFINDLARFIRDPAKTVILCHDPPRGSSPRGIDVAYSGVVKKLFIVKPKHARIFGAAAKANPFVLIHERGSIVPEPYASKLAQHGYPVSVMHRNVGNEALKAFLKRKRVNYFSCGHIHEAGHRAVSAAGKPLKHGAVSSSVWYNAAPAVKGNGGILIIDGKQATFKNIRVAA